MDDKYFELMKTLPPLVAAIVWDIVNDRFTIETVKLANATTEEEFRKYDLVRCTAAGNPSYPPLQESKYLVDEMVDEMEARMTASYPATALKDILFALQTSLNRIIEENDGSNLQGESVKELLLDAIKHHPEQQVARYYQGEIKRLFADFEGCK